MSRYDDTYRASIDKPEEFWRDAATAIDWYRAPSRVLDDTATPFYRWYPDGQLNTCHNALDRHVEAGHGERTALVYDSSVTQTKATYNYTQLLDQVSRFAGVLASLGVGKGGRVVIYMPMVPQAAIAMLACARIGAVHSVVFGGFAPHELAIRIDDAAPKVVIAPGDVMFSASDVGWVVGHSYIVYGPLLTGATTILYEGKPVGTPDPGQFWRVIAENKVKALFTAPTSLRAVKREDPQGSFIADHDVSSLRYVFLAGERLDPDTLAWAQDRLSVPVVDHWWQTETGWPVAANLMGLEPKPVKPGSATVAVPGWNITVTDVDGQPVPPGTDGAILLKLPLPPGALPTLWADGERFIESYLSRYPGYYVTGDGGHIDEDGYVFVMGRTDDVINVAGHRLSTGTMEEALAAHPAVAECAVIGVADPLKGQIPRGFVVLKAGQDVDDTVVADELVALVRSRVGAVAALKDIAIVPALPKTRSGKILRKTMREIADGAEGQIPATIDDPGVLDTIRPVLRRS